MLKQQGNYYISLYRINEKWIVIGAFFFFFNKRPTGYKTPSQVGLFQIEIFPFGKTGVNCHSKAFELLETPTILGSQPGAYEGSAVRCHAFFKSGTGLIIFAA